LAPNWHWSLDVPGHEIILGRPIISPAEAGHTVINELEANGVVYEGV
jgi:hypothetical protein